MSKGNANHNAESRDQKAEPPNPTDGRLTNNNPLTTGVQGLLQRFDDLALCRLRLVASAACLAAEIGPREVLLSAWALPRKFEVPWSASPRQHHIPALLFLTLATSNKNLARLAMVETDPLR
jgi:hypothetical protein